MSIALVRETNRCIRFSKIFASHMSNRYCWKGGVLILLNDDGKLELLIFKQYLKIGAAKLVTLFLPNNRH